MFRNLPSSELSSSTSWSRSNPSLSDLLALWDQECASGTADPLRIPWYTWADHAKVSSPPTVSFGQPTADFRSFAFGSCRLPNCLALRLLAAFRIFYPESPPFFCYGDCSGIDLGAAGISVADHLRLPAALDLPTHSYRRPGSFQPKWPACFFVTFATTVTLSGTHYRTNLWLEPLSLLRRSFLSNSTGSDIPGLFHSRAAGTWRAVAACLVSGMYC